MHAVHERMNLMEHCPDCDYELEDPEERPALVLARLPGRLGEGVRYRLMDEAA